MHTRSRSQTRRRPSFAKGKEVNPVDASPESVIWSPSLEPVPKLSLPPAAALDESQHVDLAVERSSIPYMIGALLLAFAIPEMSRIGTYAKESFKVEADPATLLGVLIAGFIAQLVDGALGMGYGLTSSTVLVNAGLSPRIASEVVHLAQLGTTLVSGLAHHRCGTVDWPTTWRVALPGVAGALVGASLLSSLPVAAAKNMASSLLLAVGAYLFARFYSPTSRIADVSKSPNALLLTPVGFVGGFIDVAGGGGWGPVATSGLLAEDRLLPSHVIGTVSLSEFFVTVAAVVAFCLLGGGHSQSAPGPSTAPPAAPALRLDLMVTLLIGGLLAAPVAPYLVTRLQPTTLGVVVGGFICLTNLRVLLKTINLDPQAYSLVLGTLAMGWVGASIRVATRPGHGSGCHGT